MHLWEKGMTTEKAQTPEGNAVMVQLWCRARGAEK
jgi:hypothetical protein